MASDFYLLCHNGTGESVKPTAQVCRGVSMPHSEEYSDFQADMNQMTIFD